MKKGVLCLLICVLVFASGACKKPGEGKEVSKPGTEGNKGGLSKPVGEDSVSRLQGAVLKNLTVVGEDGPYYCNLTENMIGTYSYMPEDHPVLVCKDPVYNITYYVNYGRDYYIYAKRGEESECAVEIPARDLYCREGVLYFRTDEFDMYTFDSFADGAILAYDPTKGSVEVVMNEPTFQMVVYPDGMLYEVDEEHSNEGGTRIVTRHQFFYSFETKESKELPPPMRTISRWKEYQLVAEISEDENRGVVGYRLETPQGESDGRSVGWTKLPALFCTMEDGIYYYDTKKDILMHYDVETDMTETVTELAFSSTFPSGFLHTEDAVYFSNGLRYSFAEDKQHLVKIREKESAHIANFYTDGESLFVLADGMLWLYEEEKVMETGYTTSELPGRSFTVGCYEAVLYPLGE